MKWNDDDHEGFGGTLILQCDDECSDYDEMVVVVVMMMKMMMMRRRRRRKKSMVLMMLTMLWCDDNTGIV